MRTNAPRMITVVIGLGLLLVGLALTLVPVASVGELVGNAVRDGGYGWSTEQVGWGTLLASNVLLVLGSLFKGI